MEDIAIVPDASTLEGTIVIIGLIVLRQLFEFAGKQIPDTATGWKAGLRRLFKTMAIYTPNKEA